VVFMLQVSGRWEAEVRVITGMGRYWVGRREYRFGLEAGTTYYMKLRVVGEKRDGGNLF